MPLRFLQRSNYGDGTIDAFSFDTLPNDGELLADPASVRFRSIAEIMLRGIQRCVAADRELQDESGRTSSPDEPVLRGGPQFLDHRAADFRWCRVVTLTVVARGFVSLLLVVLIPLSYRCPREFYPLVIDVVSGESRT